MRLWLAYPAALLTSVGLIIWGISIDKAYHWMVGQVAFALCKWFSVFLRPSKKILSFPPLWGSLELD